MNDSPWPEFGKWLRFERRARGLSQQQVAKVFIAGSVVGDRNNPKFDGTTGAETRFARATAPECLWSDAFSDDHFCYIFRIPATAVAAAQHDGRNATS